MLDRSRDINGLLASSLGFGALMKQPNEYPIFSLKLPNLMEYFLQENVPLWQKLC